MPPSPQPPLGWNSFYAFNSRISDALIREQADAMVANGMQRAGYQYVNIDDGWQGERDSHGVLHPNANFPDMKALADYLHFHGLKFGIYTSMGPSSCNGFMGSFGHEQQDAQTFID
jgi:alpha-galactosidase